MYFHHRDILNARRLYECIRTWDAYRSNAQWSRMDWRGISLPTRGARGQRDSWASVFPQKDDDGTFSGDCFRPVAAYNAVSSVEASVRHRATSFVKSRQRGSNGSDVRPHTRKIQVTVRLSCFLREPSGAGRR